MDWSHFAIIPFGSTLFCSFFRIFDPTERTWMGRNWDWGISGFFVYIRGAFGLHTMGYRPPFFSFSSVSLRGLGVRVCLFVCFTEGNEKKRQDNQNLWACYWGGGFRQGCSFEVASSRWMQWIMDMGGLAWALFLSGFGVWEMNDIDDSALMAFNWWFGTSEIVYGRKSRRVK